MHLQPIKTPEDLAKVKVRLFELMSKIIDGNATEENIHEREVWNILIDAYEQDDQREHVPQTPADLIRHEMTRMGLNQSDFAQELDVYQSHISDILRGKRALSKRIARALIKAGAMPSDVLTALLHE